jgi:methylphosphotriester-DNA--protein-cysteine methyltransferase
MDTLNWGKIYEELISYASSHSVVKATKYISPKEIIRAVRTRYQNKILKNQNIEISLTIGKPNYLEREFIKLCQKSGEPFPIKKVQLKLYNSKKSNLKKVL